MPWFYDHFMAVSGLNRRTLLGTRLMSEPEKGAADGECAENIVSTEGWAAMRMRWLAMILFAGHGSSPLRPAPRLWTRDRKAEGLW